MSNNSLKAFMNEQDEKKREKTDVEIFKSLELTENDLKTLKFSTISKEISVSALINLILQEKAGNIIKEENKEELIFRGFITKNGNITESGKLYIETEEVRIKIDKLLNEK